MQRQPEQTKTQYSVGSVVVGASGTLIPRPGTGPRPGVALEDALWNASEVDNRFARAAMAAFPGAYVESVSWPLERSGAAGSWTPLETGRSVALARWTLGDAQKARAAGGASLGAAEATRLGQLAARVANISDRDLALPESIEKIAQMAKTGAFEKALGSVSLNPSGLGARLRQAREANAPARQAPARGISTP